MDSFKFPAKIKNPIVIEGFPGFGLVGTIATEFLIEHLKCEKIGRLWFEDLPATIAIHGGEVIDPVGIFYNEKYNLVIIHSISGATGIEWDAADAVLDAVKKLKAKEIICIEGVGSPGEASPDSNVYFYASETKNHKKLQAAGYDALKEGIIMGVTSSVLLKSEIPTTALFAETQSELPDSKAAARVIEALDKYLGLKIDYQPLLKQAEKFEEKIKGIIAQAKSSEQTREKKTLSYVG